MDLDFNDVGALAREGMLRERPAVERAPDEHTGRKFYRSYRNAFGSPDRIEIDLNYMFRLPLVPPAWRDAWTPDADAPCSARVVGFEELMAGKVVALLDRAAARDLYDVALLVAPPHDPPPLRRLFIALSGSPDGPETQALPRPPAWPSAPATVERVL